MIFDISRGHIKVKIGEKVAVLQGEMFFPGNEKMGFVLYENLITHWSEPDMQPISSTEKEEIIEDVKIEFNRGGHTLEIE